MAELSAVELGEGPISIEVDGEFDLADEERAQELIDRALESSAALLIDLTTCSFMDSTGLRILLRTHMRAQTGGLRFAIAGSEPAVRRTLEITGLDESLPLYDDRTAALGALAVEPT
jgi:anti-sigma B factor antagonist